MWVERGKIDSDIDIQSEYKLEGMITGNTTVLDGGVLYLNGMISSNVIVQKGGTVFLYGMVNGDVTNDGGYIEIFGMILGNLNEISGEVIIHENSIINRKNSNIT